MHRPRQERVKAGVFEKLSRVELSMKMFECRYVLQISSARETPVSRTMVARSRNKTVSTKEKCMLYWFRPMLCKCKPIVM